MGWFWAETIPKPSIVVAPHPMPKDGASPPPACPMHDSSNSTTPVFPPRQSETATASSCPVKSPSQSSRYPTNSSDPIGPLEPQPSNQSVLSKLNPLNYMPSISNTRPTDSPQSISLPFEREISSIPRGDSDSNWEYPSPQQMYNAMLRKGHTDTPADAVESMVAVHNFLNEGAWNEIVDWENIFSQGLLKGWDRCKEGEEGLSRERAKREYLAARREALGLKATEAEPIQPKLLRFQGRPGEPTPKARILQTLSKVFPDTFGSDPPFDRHDWFISRTRPDGSVSERRYVIDYYGGGLQATGEPVFYLDIRPAVDGPIQVMERVIRWGGDVWWRGSGGSVRAQQKNEE